MQIIVDYNLETELRGGYNRILKEDCVNLVHRLHASQMRPLAIHDRHKCATCAEPIIVGTQRERTNLIPFFCGHAYHEYCLLPAMRGVASGKSMSASAAAAAAVASVTDIDGPGGSGASSSSGGPAGSNTHEDVVDLLRSGDVWCPICRSNERERRAKAARERQLQRQRRGR